MMLYHPWFVCTLWVLFTLQAQAQDAAPTPPIDSDSSVDETQLRMEALDKKLDAQNKRITTLENERAAAIAREKESSVKTKELEDRLVASQDEMEQIAISMTVAPPEKKLNIYGFFDTTFYKAWYAEDNSVLKSENPPFSTFMMSHVNLYFSSQMTNTLSALVETGFSFAPLGYETNIPIDAYTYNSDADQWDVSPGFDDSEYERVDTYVPGSYTSTSIRYGSVSIVRAHLDWTPRDWLNFRMGQFLTPYGIWNVEHASTVLTGVYYPNLMNWDLVPSSQLGVQAYGNIFPTDFLQLKYALTLSNGRGPTSTVMDLDENKGVGARIQTIFSRGKWQIVAGSYGYFGKYTDAERRFEIYIDSERSMGSVSDSPLGATIVNINKFKEYIITADLSVEAYGLKLFGEFVHRKVDYLIHPDIPKDIQFLQNGNINKDRKAANHYAQSAYAILAYTLPIRAFNPAKITPYLGVDWLIRDNSLSWIEQKTFRGGLNIQPSPFVAIKTEGIIDNFDELLGGRMTSLSAQLAVSF